MIQRSQHRHPVLCDVATRNESLEKCTFHVGEPAELVPKKSHKTRNIFEASSSRVTIR